MNNETKQDYRAVIDITQSLQRVRDAKPITTLDESFEQCKRWQRRVEIASKRNWLTAASDSRERLRGALDILRMRATHSIDELAQRSRSQIKLS